MRRLQLASPKEDLYARLVANVIPKVLQRPDRLSWYVRVDEPLHAGQRHGEDGMTTLRQNPTSLFA